MIKNAKMEKSDLSLNTYVQYVEDFKFWVMAAGLPHRIPEKEIVKCFVNGLKPELFKEEMFSRSCDTLVEVMAAARAHLATYRDILETSERVKKPEVKKNSKKGPIMLHRRQTRIFIKRHSAVQVPFHLLFAKSSKNKILKMLNALNAIKRSITPISARKSSRRNLKECSKCEKWKIKVRSNRMINC